MKKTLTRFIELCCAEPFRIFFPLGALLGIIGVSLWPLFFGHVITTYPGLAHARLMIEGMMGAFIFGFLGTAGPRLTETRTFSKMEVGVLLTLQTASMALHLASRIAWGDLVFLDALIWFMRCLVLRFDARSDLPPPNFVLVALGFLSGIAGAALLLLTECGMNSIFAYRFGDALLNQGFVLFPVLGAGAFLVRKFLGFESPGEVPSLRAPSREWRVKAAFCAGIGVAIIGSFALEAFDFPRIAGAVRAAAVALYLVAATPMLRRALRPDFLAVGLRLAMISLLLAPLWLIWFAKYPVAGLHILFIGGFSLSVFTVGARVILGHSGQARAFNKVMPFVVTLSVLLAFALMARIGADILLKSRAAHLVSAAFCWLLAAMIWSVRLLPHVGISDESE